MARQIFSNGDFELKFLEDHLEDVWKSLWKFREAISSRLVTALPQRPKENLKNLEKKIFHEKKKFFQKSTF